MPRLALVPFYCLAGQIPWAGEWELSGPIILRRNRSFYSPFSALESVESLRAEKQSKLRPHLYSVYLIADCNLEHSVETSLREAYASMDHPLLQACPWCSVLPGGNLDTASPVGNSARVHCRS